MTSRIAITGGTGFVGRALVAECLSRGIAVRVLARNATAASAIWSGLPVEVVQGDLADPRAIDALVTGAATVIHLAYLKGGREANVAAARELAAASRRAGVRRVVYCSTALVVGRSERAVIDETVPDAPSGEYQLTKAAIEAELRAEVLGWGSLAILRPTEIIGPGGQGLRSSIQRLAAESPAVRVVRRMILGARRFNYVCIGNVVAGLLHLAEAPLPGNGELFYLSDDDDPDNNYAAVEGHILNALGRPSSAPWPALPRAVLVLVYRMSPDRAPPNRTYSSAKIQRLGYRKVTSLRTTVKEVVLHEVGPALQRT